MKDFSIKLGFVSTRRLAFDKKEAQEHKNLIRDKLLSWKIDLVDIDWLNEDGMFYDIEGVEKVYQYFLANNVDALLAKKAGKPYQNQKEVDFPTFEDGTRGVKFINLCVESSQRGACWI